MVYCFVLTPCLRVLLWTKQISFWGMMPPPGGGARRNNIRGVAKGLPPQAIIVGQLRSPGVQLDLGRVKTSLAETKPTCDVLLVMTRSKAVLLYFQLDQDLRYVAQSI